MICASGGAGGGIVGVGGGWGVCVCGGGGEGLERRQRRGRISKVICSSDSLFTKFYNKESVSKGCKHTNISKRQD